MNPSYQADADKLLTELNNGLLTIIFNRPEAMNALHPEMLTSEMHGHKFNGIDFRQYLAVV